MNVLLWAVGSNLKIINLTNKQQINICNIVMITQIAHFIWRKIHFASSKLTLFASKFQLKNINSILDL